MDAIRDAFQNEEFKFYTGTSYRHITVWKNGEVLDFEPPHDHLGQVIGQFLPAGGTVFAFEFAGLEGVPVIQDILDQPVVFSLPGPGLERNSLTGFCFVDIGWGIGRLVHQQCIVIPDAGNEHTARCELVGNAPDGSFQRAF